MQPDVGEGRREVTWTPDRWWSVRPPLNRVLNVAELVVAVQATWSLTGSRVPRALTVAFGVAVLVGCAMLAAEVACRVIDRTRPRRESRANPGE